MKVAAHTLGCKVNQYDTEAILQDFSSYGFDICDFNEQADIYIINTCTVTNMSDKKSRQLVNRAYKQNPCAMIIAYGCYAQVDPEALRKQKGVTLVLGTADKHRVAEIVMNHVTEQSKEINSKKVNSYIKAKRTRAYLKIQDGCDRFCSYCIVPYARGDVVSRSVSDILTEAKSLVQNGTKEIVLAGIQIASYGKDLLSNDSKNTIIPTNSIASKNIIAADNNLIDLIKYIHDIPGLERLRLSSIEPNLINDHFLNIAKKLPKLCNHFHLSLQSGCDRILEKMNRRYNTEFYSIAAEKIHSCFPEATLTTDIIVGFPGETEDDFEETLAFAKKIGFFRIHVFSYSPKTGTPAAAFPDQLNASVKEQRSQLLRSLADKMNHDIYRQYINKTLPVLFESSNNTFWEGHTTQYLKVHVHSHENLSNMILPVRIEELQNDVAYATLNGGF